MINHFAMQSQCRAFYCAPLLSGGAGAGRLPIGRRLAIGPTTLAALVAAVAKSSRRVKPCDGSIVLSADHCSCDGNASSEPALIQLPLSQPVAADCAMLP